MCGFRFARESKCCVGGSLGGKEKHIDYGDYRLGPPEGGGVIHGAF